MMTNDTCPKWQRARILPCSSKPELTGYLVWTEVKSPHYFRVIDPDGHDTGERCEGLHTHIVDYTCPNLGDRRFAVPVRNVELLPVFADDISLVSYDEWEQEQHTYSQVREEDRPCSVM